VISIPSSPESVSTIPNSAAYGDLLGSKGARRIIIYYFGDCHQILTCVAKLKVTCDSFGLELQGNYPMRPVSGTQLMFVTLLISERADSIWLSTSPGSKVMSTIRTKLAAELGVLYDLICYNFERNSPSSSAKNKHFTYEEFCGDTNAHGKHFLKERNPEKAAVHWRAAMVPFPHFYLWKVACASVRTYQKMWGVAQSISTPNLATQFPN